VQIGPESHPVITITDDMRAMRYYAAFAFAVLLVLGGCTAATKRQSEAQFNLPPDLSRVCLFQWSAEKASYRTANISGFAWTNAVNRGYPDLQSYLDGLFAECRHVPEMAAARVDATGLAQTLDSRTGTARGRRVPKHPGRLGKITL